MTDVDPIRRFIIDHFFLSENALRDADDEIYPRLIDRRDLVEVADFIEETYGIFMSEADMHAVAETCRSLNTIAAFVGRKRGESNARA